MKNSTPVSDLYNVLSNPLRRALLEYFHASDEKTASLEDLVSHVRQYSFDARSVRSDDASFVRTQLHHVHLPKLDEHDVIEYDPRSSTVRYRPDPSFERGIEEILGHVRATLA